jgi:hypothetical protein
LTGRDQQEAGGKEKQDQANENQVAHRYTSLYSICKSASTGGQESEQGGQESVKMKSID